MENENGNVILFPNWEEQLKQDSLQALQARKFEDALNMLDMLLHYQVTDYEIIIAKIMCLMEMERYSEAEEFCEEVINTQHDDHYYQYLHMYFTILFHENKYDVLMERIEEEMDSHKLPSHIKEQFLELYHTSKAMATTIIEKKSSVYIDKLFEAVSESNYEKQWQSLVQLESLKTELDERVIRLLDADHIHPVIQTKILLLIQRQNYVKLVKVKKFGQQLQVNPKELASITEHPTYQKVMMLLQDVEQENPTLYQFLTQLLYRYLYVLYPFIPKSNDAEIVAESLTIIGNQMLNNKETELADDNVLQLVEQINYCEQLYLSIIEE